MGSILWGEKREGGAVKLKGLPTWRGQVEEGQEPTSEIKKQQPRNEREENCEKVAPWKPEERRVLRSADGAWQEAQTGVTCFYLRFLSIFNTVASVCSFV